jgi:hypothetical protein
MEELLLTMHKTFGSHPQHKQQQEKAGQGDSHLQS